MTYKTRDILKDVFYGALIVGGSILSGCKGEAPKRSDYATGVGDAYCSKGKIGLIDRNNDGKVDDLYSFKETFHIAVDTNKVNFGKMEYLMVMTPKMVDLATKINDLEKELAFQIDSTENSSIHK